MKHLNQRDLIAAQQAAHARARAAIKKIQAILRQDAADAATGDGAGVDTRVIADELEGIAEFLAPANDPAAR